MVVLILIQALISQFCNYFYLFRTHRGYVINCTLKTVLKIRVIVSRQKIKISKILISHKICVSCKWALHTYLFNQLIICACKNPA